MESCCKEYELPYSREARSLWKSGDSSQSHSLLPSEVPEIKLRLGQQGAYLCTILLASDFNFFLTASFNIYTGSTSNHTIMYITCYLIYKYIFAYVHECFAQIYACVYTLCMPSALQSSEEVLEMNNFGLALRVTQRNMRTRQK